MFACTSRVWRSVRSLRTEGPTFRLHVYHESKQVRLLSHVLFHLKLTAPADDHLGHGYVVHCAWAAAPAPARSQTPQPTSSSFVPARLSCARSNSLRQTSFKSSTVAPPSALSRAGTLPVRTPAPPGGWFSPPGSLRRKTLKDGSTVDMPTETTNYMTAALLPP